MFTMMMLTAAPSFLSPIPHICVQRDGFLQRIGTDDMEEPFLHASARVDVSGRYPKDKSVFAEGQDASRCRYEMGRFANISDRTKSVADTRAGYSRTGRICSAAHHSERARHGIREKSMFWTYGYLPEFSCFLKSDGELLPNPPFWTYSCLPESQKNRFGRRIRRQNILFLAKNPCFRAKMRCPCSCLCGGNCRFGRTVTCQNPVLIPKSSFWTYSYLPKLVLRVKNMRFGRTAACRNFSLLADANHFSFHTPSARLLPLPKFLFWMYRFLPKFHFPAKIRAVSGGHESQPEKIPVLDVQLPAKIRNRRFWTPNPLPKHCFGRTAACQNPRAPVLVLDIPCQNMHFGRTVTCQNLFTGRKTVIWTQNPLPKYLFYALLRATSVDCQILACAVNWKQDT